MIKNASAVIALTNDMKKTIKNRIYNRDIYVIPNGIDLKSYNKYDKKTIRKKYVCNRAYQGI